MLYLFFDNLEPPLVGFLYVVPSWLEGCAPHIDLPKTERKSLSAKSNLGLQRKPQKRAPATILLFPSFASSLRNRKKIFIYILPSIIVVL
eukprot:gene10133-7092_t